MDTTSQQPPPPSPDALRGLYVGKTLDEVPKPALVLDVAKARRHCRSMLDAVRAMGCEVGFRAHVKTHKTVELARLQVGDRPGDPAKFVVSTVPEMEMLLPLLKELISQGRRPNVLYGIPLPKSQLPRLASLARELVVAAAEAAAETASGSLAAAPLVSIMADHPAQLDALLAADELSPVPTGVFLKIDTGYHRAGVPPAALDRQGLLSRALALDAAGRITLQGLYSHSSLSYADTTAAQAIVNLAAEIAGCVAALRAHAGLFRTRGNAGEGGAQTTPRPPPLLLTISVGATPQAAAVQNLPLDSSDPDMARAGAALGAVIKDLEELASGADATPSGLGLPGIGLRLELHAGVYASLDMQQLATNARGARVGAAEEEVATSVLAEVCSVYGGGERARPEALVAVGVLGLGREPCPSYAGWGVVSARSYGASSAVLPAAGAGRGRGRRRLVVARISQEHGILAWEEAAGGAIGEGEDLPPIPLEYGQTVEIYPNHACITGAMYGHYFVVDSEDEESKGKRVVDVWRRAGGW